MSQRVVSAVWTPGPLNTTVAFDTGATLLVDEPVDVGGTGLGPQPTDLFLASVSSCFTLALVYAAGKAAITLDSVRVVATGTYAGPRFSSIAIHVELGGDVREDQRVELLSAAERVCYVTNTLRRPPELEITLA
jgi:putative redox protein